MGTDAVFDEALQFVFLPTGTRTFSFIGQKMCLTLQYESTEDTRPERRPFDAATCSTSHLGRPVVLAVLAYLRSSSSLRPTFYPVPTQTCVHSVPHAGSFRRGCFFDHGYMYSSKRLKKRTMAVFMCIDYM